MTKIYVTRNRRTALGTIVKAPFSSIYSLLMVTTGTPCKSATVAIYSCLSVDFLLEDNVET